MSWTKGATQTEGSWQRACSTGGHGPAPPPQPTRPGTPPSGALSTVYQSLKRQSAVQFLQLGPQQDVLLGLGADRAQWSGGQPAGTALETLLHPAHLVGHMLGKVSRQSPSLSMFWHLRLYQQVHNLRNIDATPPTHNPQPCPHRIPLLGLQLPTFTPTDFTQPAPRTPVEFSLFHLLQEAFLDPQGVLAIYSRKHSLFPFLSILCLECLQVTHRSGLRSVRGTTDSQDCCETRAKERRWASKVTRH